MLLYLFFGAKNGSNTTGSAIKNFFPFGTGGVTVSNKPPAQTTQQTPPSSTITAPGVVIIPRLRKVSNNPVVGYTITQKEVPVDPNSIAPPKVIPIAATFTFTKDLKLGSKGVDVTQLEKILNQCPQTVVATKGVGSLGKEGTVFGISLQKAVVAFQEKFSDDILKPQNETVGTGIVDELTRKELNAGFSCTEIVVPPKTIIKDVVRYVEKGTSNIYDAFADTLATTRLSNTTMPGVHEAFFGNQGKTVFMRYLKDDNQTIETFIGTVPEPVVGGDALPQLTGSLMPENIEDMSISPDGTQLLYLLPSANSLLGFVSDLDGKNQKRVFSSAFFGWLSQWATPKSLVFTVKATAYGDGFAYVSDLGQGGFSKIIGNIAGLTTLMSPNGKYVLFSHNAGAGPGLGLLATDTKQVHDIGLSSLPEKCAWDRKGLTVYCATPYSIPSGHLFPDDWYQGTVAFDDSFWIVDVTGTYNNQKLFDPVSEGGESTDGVNLRVDDSNKYLYFVNRKTGILWQYDLSPAPPAPIPPVGTTAVPPAATTTP